jgi:cytochrome b6-f complex iron-sulfur subunit
MFAWPRSDSQQTTYNLGSIDDYRMGTVTTIDDGEFHLVRGSEDTLIAISWTDPGNRCIVPWRPTFEFNGRAGWFRDPCSGSTYDREGLRVSGPSPRHVDRYAIDVVNGNVTVDTTRYVCGFAPPNALCVTP